MEILPDHVHLFLNCPPTLSPSDAMFWHKGYSSRILRKIRGSPTDALNVDAVVFRVDGRKCFERYHPQIHSRTENPLGRSDASHARAGRLSRPNAVKGRHRPYHTADFSSWAARVGAAPSMAPLNSKLRRLFALRLIWKTVIDFKAHSRKADREFFWRDFNLNSQNVAGWENGVLQLHPHTITVAEWMRTGCFQNRESARVPQRERGYGRQRTQSRTERQPKGWLKWLRL